MPLASVTPLHDGPRERALAEGVSSLGDAEIVALLLGTGSAGRPVARAALKLLEAAGGVGALLGATPFALAEVPGVGLAKAVRVVAALELGRRALARSAEPREPLSDAAHVARWAAPRLAHLEHEQMWLLSLDGRNALRSARRIAEGGLHGLSLRPRDALRVAVRDAASAFVLVHNHPSGDPSPSREDHDRTRAVAAAADAVGVPLVDHVVVAASGYASFHELGLLPGHAR